MLKRRAYVVFGSGGTQEAGGPAAAGEPADAAGRRPRNGPAGDGFGARGHERYPIDLPEGWAIRLEEPLVVYANGLCLGAGLPFHQGAEDVRLVLEPPYCRVAPDA